MFYYSDEERLDFEAYIERHQNLLSSTIIAFSGEKEFHGQQPALTSAGLNGFPDNKIQKTFKQGPYRFLIVADMFQTGCVWLSTRIACAYMFDFRDSIA